MTITPATATPMGSFLAAAAFSGAEVPLSLMAQGIGQSRAYLALVALLDVAKHRARLLRRLAALVDPSAVPVGRHGTTDGRGMEVAVDGPDDARAETASGAIIALEGGRVEVRLPEWRANEPGPHPRQQLADACRGLPVSHEAQARLREVLAALAPLALAADNAAYWYEEAADEAATAQAAPEDVRAAEAEAEDCWAARTAAREALWAAARAAGPL